MTITIKALYLSLSCLIAMACTQPEPPQMPSVLDAFAIGDFVPHVPSVADVRAELGGLLVEEIEEERFYTYRTDNLRWVAIRASEAAQEKYAGVEEIIYSAFPPTEAATHQTVGKKLARDSLMGIRLDDDAEKIGETVATLVRSETRLFGRLVATYEMSPKPEADELFYRFFIENGKVVAFSLGVTE